jgi:cell division septation protein DedD
MGERKDLKDLLRDTDFTQKRIIDDLASSDVETYDESRDVGRDLRRSEGGDFIKNFFVGILLVAIVIGSFWVSFLIGKKVLVPPVKNLPVFETTQQAPKPISKNELESATPVQEEAPIQEREIKETEVKASLPKPIAPVVKKRIVSAFKQAEIPLKTLMPKTTRTTVAKAGTFYKVIVGNYATVAETKQATTALRVGGFQTYAKKTTAGYYRIQAGAFDTREKALPLVNKLKAKGFNPTIIAE